MAGKILQIDDVAASLAGGRQCRDPQRMDGDVRFLPISARRGGLAASAQIRLFHGPALI
jgi:hypothetical protein